MRRLALVPLLLLVAATPLALPRDANAPPADLGGMPAATPPGADVSASATASTTATPTTSATPDTTPEPSPTTAPSPTSTAQPGPTAQPGTVVDRYLAAAALVEADPAAAAEGFAAIAAAPGSLSSYARYRAAEALALAAADGHAAETYARVADDAAIASALRVRARFRGAELFAAIDAPDAALALLAGVDGEPAAAAADRAAAHWARAELLQAADDPSWVDHAKNALTASPASAAARSAADALIEAGAPTNPLDLAYAYYRGRQNTDARDLYASIVDAGAASSTLAVARFYLGALAERTGEREQALDHYAASIEAAPAGPLADDARYWRGRVLEELGEDAAAVNEFDRLADEYPTSPFIEDAATRAAVRVGLGGAPDEATQRFDALIEVRGGAAAATAARWAQLFEGIAGIAPTPRPSASSFDPSSLGALLEASGSQWLAALPPGASAERPAAWTTAERAAQEAITDEWMGARYGPAPADDGALPRLPLVQLLLGVDEADFARLVMREELDAQAEPYGRVAVAREASALGLHDVALIAALRVLGGLTVEQRLASPRELERFAYPLPYADEVDGALAATTASSDVPPLLLYALVRQESAFNPSAGSRAGALGLTQVIEPTGAAIAADLREPFDLDALFDPGTSLRFGTHYLATQLDFFDGNVLAALAAYNGGPGNSARWLARAELPGGDGFIYAVEFAETRLYLERVLENYAWYRYLYLDLDAPALPWPSNSDSGEP